MSERPRVNAPTAEEIQRRFGHPLVHVARPIILGGIGVLGAVRRFKWTAEGVEKVLEHDRPLIFASNHCSHADTAAILGTLPFLIRRRTCVAAALDVFGPAQYVPRKTWRYFKRECLQIIVAAGFHAFAFDRQGPPLRSLRTALELSRNDWSLLLYPEGTRSRSGKMAPFKPGIGVLAKMTGRPVIPVHVTGGRSILPCGRFMPQPGHAMVRYGDALWHRRGESPEEFTARLERRVRALAPAGEAVADAAAIKTEPSLATAAGGSADAPKRAP
ncbi:MAG: lysophospholipid acyltransferase family protein [Planctomycetota bacterium]|nr:lysophospholipid acyltransferase family protein [Planctomycetota bacterium]